MGTSDRRHDELIDLLKNCDLAYSFKKKRLRYIRSAAANREIIHLRDTFPGLWAEESGLFRLKNPSISQDAIRIIRGIFGNSGEASALLYIDTSIAAIERDLFDEFIDTHIASPKAGSNFKRIFFGGDDSIQAYVRRQIEVLARYIPTMKKFDAGDMASLRIDRHDQEIIIEIMAHMDEIEDNLSRDIRRYHEFIRDFKSLYRESATVNIVGYGEISTVMRLRKRGWDDPVDIVNDDTGWIWKKMPPFPRREDVDRFERLYVEYRRILTDEIGICVPAQITRHFRHDRYYTVYAGQKMVESRHICHTFIKKLDPPNANRLLVLILNALNGVYAFNRANPHVSVGIDAQLSNWVFVSRHNAPETVHADDGLTYLDTSSPLFRIDGEEQINTEIFIKSAASFLRPVIRKFFLKEVVDRYYDIRSVIIDIIANLYKEKRADLIDGFIETTNGYFMEAGLKLEPIRRKEIDAYYSNDAFIWRFYQASRKIDRFIIEKIFRKKYIFRIPGAIER